MKSILLLLLLAISVQANEWFLYTPITGPRVVIDTENTQTFWFYLDQGGWNLTGAKLTIKRGPRTAGNLVLEIFKGKDNEAPLLATKAFPADFMVGTAYEATDFLLDTPLTTEPGYYFFQLSSSAPPRGFFIKGLKEIYVTNDEDEVNDDVVYIGDCPLDLEKTKSPTLSPGAEITQTPTTSPATQVPTTSPSTKAPTNQPSESPEKDCSAIVTCCFTGQDQLLNIWLNDVEVSSDVQGNFANRDAAKTWTFNEPEVDSLVSFKVYSKNELLRQALRIRCSSSRPDSLWNFEGNPDSSWMVVAALDYRADQFPPLWWTTGYNGTQEMAVTTTNFVANPATCQIADQAKITGQERRYYMGLRKTVVNNC